MGLWQVAQPLQAASLTWTAGSGTDFNWANSANWRGGLPQFLDDVGFNSPIPNPGSLASPGTINLGSGSTARSLRFNDDYTLQGGDLSLSLGGVSVGDGSTARISSVMTGTGGLQKDGLGTLILDADNTGLTGNVILNNGILVASGQAKALGTGQLRLIGGQLNLQGDTGTAFGNNTVVLGPVVIASDRVSAGAGVTHSLGTLSIGGQTLSAQAGPNVTSGTAGVTFGATALTANGTRFDVGSGANLTLGAMTGNNSIYKSGAGTLTLVGTSTRANATAASVIYEGRVVQGTAAGLGAATAPLFLAGGTTMQLSSDASTNAYPTTVFGNVNLVPDRATSGAAVTHTLGALTSIGANTYTVSAGANVASLTADVRFGAATATGATSLVVGAGSRFTLNSTFNNNGFDTTVSGAGDVTLAGAVSGGGGIVMNGNGLLTLSSANTQGKATVVNSGRVQLGNATALGATAVANAVLNGLGVLSTNGQNISVQSIQSAAGTTVENRSATASTITLTPGPGINSVLAGNLINGGTATLGVTVNTTAGGQVTLSGNNTHTGTTTLTQGRLNIDSNTALGTGGLTLTAGMIDNTSGGDVALTANNAVTFGGTAFTFGGTGNLSFGTGVVTSAAARTVTLMGDAGKTLSFGNWVNSYPSSTTTVNAVPGSNSTLRVAAFNSTSTASPGTIAGNGNLIITGGITPTAPSGASVVFSNAGTITLNGASTYTGATTFNAGTVRLNAAGGTATLQPASATTFAGGTFHYLGAAAGSSQRLGNVTLGAGGSSILVTGGTSGTSALNFGTASGAGFTLGTATQAALNIRLVGGNSPTVTTTLAASALVNGLMGARGAITFTDVSGNTRFATLTTSSGDNVISGLNIATTLPASGGVAGTNYIVNDTSVTVTGNVAANALQLNSSGTAQSLTLNSGQILTLTSGGLLYTGSGAFTVAGTGSVRSNSGTATDLIIHNYGTGGLTISAVIANGTGTSPLTVSGPGVTTLTGANTYTGVTYVTGGSTLSIPNNTALGAGALILNNGTLQISGTFSSARVVTLGLGGGTIEVNGGATHTVSGTIGGPGNLIKKGAGTLLLTGASTPPSGYTGAFTQVQDGVMQIGGSAGALPLTSTLVLGNGATSGVLVLGDGANARSATFTGLMTSGTGTANQIKAGGAGASGTLTYNGVPGTPSVFNGVIGGAGINENNLNLTLTAGILTLGGENTYNGMTTLNGGVLNINHASAIGTGALTLNAAAFDNTSGAPITLVGGRAITLGNNISFGATNSLDLGAGSTMTMTAGRTITLHGMPGSTSRLSVGTLNSTVASTLTVNRVQASDAVLSVGVFNLASTTSGTASITGNGNVEITGQLLATAPGATAFTYGGSGTLTVFGSSSYTGATTISGPGLLRLGAGGSLPSASAFTISSGVFDLNGNNQSLNGTFTLTGPGTISNSSATAATLTVASLSTANTGNLAGNLSAVMTQTGAATSMSGSYTNTGSLSFNNNGTGALTISGSLLNGGDVTLSANNTQVITVSSAVINSGGSIINNGSGTGTTTIQGNLGLDVSGVVQNSPTSNLVLTGNNSQFAGSISLNAGNIQVSSGATYRFDALALEAGSQILIGPVGGGASLGGSTTLIFNDSGTKTISGSILTTGTSLGGELNLEKGGSADWTLASSLSHNGTTTVSGGILRLAPASLSELIPDRSALILGNAAGVQVVLDGRTETVGSLSGGGASGGQVQLGSGGHLLVGSDGTSTVFGGAILGTNAFLTKQGNGVLTLTGQSSFSGLLDITGGGVVLARPGGQALSSSVDVRLGNAGTVLSVASSETIGRLNTAADSTLLIASGATLTTNHASASVVRSAKAHASTRVMTVPGGTDGLKVGMIVSATDGNPDLATGTYIVQIINHNQVLLSNTPIATTSSSGKNFTFREVDQMLGGISGAGSWTKLGGGNVVLAGPGNLSGTMTIADGAVIAGGVNVGGRNIIQDTVGNLTSVVLGDSGSPSFILASNGLNLAPFERIGSLGGGHLGDGSVGNPGVAIVSLTGFNSSGVLAVGANNQDSTYRGRITGTSNSLLLKEGSGVFTWTNNDAATALDGTVWVERGEMISNGTEGLGAGSNVVVSNAPGAKLTLGVSSSQGESLTFISGGGRGATRVFPNGVTGALTGNFLSGGGGTIDVGSGLALTSTATAAQYVYGGALTGVGGIDKQGNNTLELRGVSSYEGVTLVRPAAGVASNVNSVLTIGAYGASSGVGAPSGTGGYGQLPATTALRLQAGLAGSVNANAIFNLNGSTQTVIALTSLNSGGTKTLNFGGGVININNVAGTASNGFFDGALSGLGTINVNATHADGWRLTADTSAASVNNNIVHRGNLNINGGQVILEGTLGSIGDTVHVRIGSGAQLRVNRSDTTGSLSGSGNLVLDAGFNLVLTSAPQGGASTAGWSGTSSGGGGLILENRARLLMSTNQGYTGDTTVSGGSRMTLSYGGGGVNNIIPGNLRLMGGTLELAGGSTSAVVENVTVTRLGAGASSITQLPGMAGRINLGSIVRSLSTGSESGSVLQVFGTAASTITENDPVLGMGILGGYATYGATGAAVTTWAVGSPDGLLKTISGLPDISYLTVNASNPPAIGASSDVKGDFSFSSDTGSLRFNTAPAPASSLLLVDMVGEHTDMRIIESGGILVTKNFGDNDILFTGKASLSGGSGDIVANELVIHQHNTLGTLTMETTLVNNPYNPYVADLSLTKAGKGKVVLVKDNEYSGTTNILDGVLQVGDGSQFTGSLGSSSTILNNGWLSLKHGINLTSYLYSQISGIGSLRVESGATEVLSGANSSFLGGTYVVSGTLQVNNSTSQGGTGLGATAGLTSVAPGGTLAIGANGLSTVETIYLRGGMLSALSGGALFRSPVLVGESSSLRSNFSGSALTFAAPIITRPGAALTLTGTGTMVFNTSQSVLGQVQSSTNIYVGGAPLGGGAAGSLGRGAVTNNGTITVNMNDTHFALANNISGSGSLSLYRNVIHVTGNNTYAGTTFIGGNPNSFNVNADVRVGGENYDGRLGGGAIIVQSSSGAGSSLRYQTLRNVTLNNNITLNPWSNGTTGAFNALFHRMGLGSVTIAGTLTAGSHSQPGQNPFTQRALLQSEPGGVLTIAGPVVNGEDNRLNFQPVSNSVIEIAGTASNTLWGRFLGNNSDNTTANTIFRNTGTTTLKGYNNFASTGGTNRRNVVYIQRGSLVVDHTYLSDPDAANASQVPDGINNDANIYLLRGAMLQFNRSETIGELRAQSGSTIAVPTGVVLTIDNGISGNNNHVVRGNFTGDGTVLFSALNAAAWYGLYGASSLTGPAVIGSTSQITTARVADLGYGSGLGLAQEITLGVGGVLGNTPQEARLEYVSRSTTPHVTTRDFNLSASATLENRTLAEAVGDPTNVIKLNDVTGLALNMAVSGPNIAPGSRVTGINAGLNTITLSFSTLPGGIEAGQPIVVEDASQAATVRIGSNAIAPLIIGSDSSSSGSNGRIRITNLSNKTLILHGQTVGNEIRGMIDQGGAVLSLVANPKVADNDQYGHGRWTISNANNNFSGSITVNVGALEFAGNLGNGTNTTGVMGDLTAARTIDLGTNDFNGRRYAFTGGGDGLGAGGGAASTGSIIFNDPNPGVLNLGSNISFTQSFSSTTNPGSGRISNNGTKTVVINGSLTSGADGNRSWILDGTNTGDNIINGVISKGAGAAVVGIQKDGPGKWVLNSTTNTMTGTVTVNRGTLEVAGGASFDGGGTPANAHVGSIGDDSIVSLANAGSDGSSVGVATFRLRGSETIGGLAGAVGTGVILDENAILTVRNANQTYSGIISGGGGLTRTNNDTNARVSILPNRNTYTGPTTITTNGTNLVANRIDVYHLANAGQASGIGSAAADAANLVLNTGTGGGGLRWLGFADQSTDRLFTIGAGTSAANIWADGTVIGGTAAPKIEFTNTGDVAFTGSGNRTLVLRGATIADNLMAPRLTDNGADITSLSKIEGGLWILSNNNTYSGGTTITAGTLAVSHGSALGTGLVTINGGGGVGLEIRGGAGGISMANNITNSTASGGIQVRSGSNTLSGLVTLTANMGVAVDSGASLNLSNAASSVTGSGTLIKSGAGTLVLSGANTAGWTGAVQVRGGTLELNYATGENSKLPDGAALTLGTAGVLTLPGVDDNVSGQTNIFGTTGGAINLVGGGNNYVEQIGSLTLSQGASEIRRAAGSTATINLENITRAAGSGATIDFSAAEIATTNNFNDVNGGILATSGGAAGAAVGAYATVGKTSWAVTSNTGSDIKITALASNLYASNSYTSGSNTDVSGAAPSTSGAATAFTLRFNQNQATTLTLGGLLSLEGAGILVTPNVGANHVIITGNAIQNNSAAASLDAVILHQHNISGHLQINSVIQNNTSAHQITKSGAGKVFLNAINTQTGAVNINEGEIQVGGTAAAPSTATAATLGGSTALPVNMSQGAALTFLSSDTALQTLGVVQGGGTITLAAGNLKPVLLSSDSGSFAGEIVISGGVLQISGNNNALGSNRGRTTINAGGTLQINDNRSTGELITMNQNSTIALLAAATGATISGRMTLANSTPAGAVINLPAGSALTVSGLIDAGNGFTKNGNGILTLSASNFSGVLDGFTAANADATLRGQILLNAGEIRVGNARALGASGFASRVTVASGATLDLRGQATAYVDDSDPFRKFIEVQGSGVNGTGALRNTSGTGTFSHLVFSGNATLSGGGFANGSRLDLASYDINTNTGSTLDGNFTRVFPTLAGNGHELTVKGASQGGGVVLHQPTFTSALGKITVQEGILRLEMDAPVNSAGLWGGIGAADVTGGIEIAYAGATFTDYTTPASGNSPNVGARLNLYRNFNVHHSVPITMNGVVARGGAADLRGGGANYIDFGNDTLPNPRTYLDGNITVLGEAARNIFHIDASGSGFDVSIVEQGNLTGSIQSKLIVGGQITGAGGFTKTGYRELRLTNNNTFTGEMNILRHGTAAVDWQSNTVAINGVNYQTYGEAEGWAEWGVTLTGVNAQLSGVSAINLQRRGMLTLDNTGRLDATSNVVGGNNNNRINDAGTFNMNNGWLRIHGGTAPNTEKIATEAGAAVRVASSTNMIDLWPLDGAGQPMTLTIGRIERSPGAVLRIRNLDATSTFGSAEPSEGVDSVRVLLNSTTGISQYGSGTSATNKAVVAGVFGGIMPHTYLADLRDLGYNNANASDLYNQGRNLQYATGSHFMTLEGGYLRPLDDSEYYTPADGVLDALNGAGQNVNLNVVNAIVRQDMTVNSLRFGPLSDSRGDNVGTAAAINNGTTLTSYSTPYVTNLFIDGRLTVASGMVSSAYFAMGDSTNGNNAFINDTVIAGGTLAFGSREAIINNQNAVVRFTDGTVQVGNSFNIRSDITGSGGLTKTGIGQVVLDGYNTYTGVTYVGEGNLLLRNGRSAAGAGGPGNHIYITGSGQLLTGNGIVVGAPGARKDILVGPLTGNQIVMNSSNDLNYLYGNITVDNVDAAGQAVFIPLMSASGGNSVLIVDGNITGGSTPIVNDTVASSSRILNLSGSANAFVILRGQLGDRLDANGNAIPVSGVVASYPTGTVLSTGPAVGSTVTNQNEVFRFTVTGNNDLNVIMERQTNAAGRLLLDQGVLYISYDPSAAGNDGTGFWTNTAISRIAGGDSNGVQATNGNTTQHGFNIGGAGNTAIFLGQPGANGVSGQSFNMTSWTINSGNTTYMGGINETGSVSYGTGNGTLTLAKQARLYAMAGGTVNLNMRLSGSTQSILKTGRGNVVLMNASLATAGDVGSFELGGGTLTIDHNGANVARLGAAGNFTFRGGSMVSLGRTNAAFTANYSTDTAAVRTVAFTAGVSEIEARTMAAQSLTINLGNTNATNGVITRTAGAAVSFIENQAAGGTAAINLQFGTSTALVRDRIISWATYGNASRTALDFARVNTSNRVTTATALRSGAELNNNVATWAAGQNVSENGGAGFGGTLGGSLSINTLRFDTMSDSFVSLGGNTLTIAGDGVAGGILASTATGAASKTIANGTISNSTDLVVHQYGQGNLTIGAVITGTGSLTIAGPSTTLPSQFNTTGTVKLTGANTYTGTTYVNGAVLEVASTSALGTNPTSNTNSQLTLNGGTLRWTGGIESLGNRGVTVQGNGGVIEVARPDGNLILGNAISVAQPALVSEDQFRGDLIKTGPGTLTFMSGGNAYNGSFQGLLDIRQGSLVVMADVADPGNNNTGTTTILGTNRSWADGTVFRQGTSFQAFLGNGNNGGDWNIEEFLTFEGNNTFTYSGLLDINANLGLPASLDGQLNLGSRRPLNLFGAINFAGTTTFDVGALTNINALPTVNAANVSIVRFTNGQGYIMGSGDIVKDGLGQLEFRGNSMEWRGGLVIKQGTVYASNQGDALGTGYLNGKTIKLGDADRGGVAQLMINNPDGIHNWVFDIKHDIDVAYNPAQTKRLGVDNTSNGSRVSFDGNITLNDSLALLIQDGGISSGGEQTVLNLNGSLRDGAVTSGNINIQVSDSSGPGAGAANDNANGRMAGYLVLNGNNSAWTGDISISANLTNDFDKTTILRFGHNQALTAANDVTMNYNSILQSGGRSVTIGNLVTAGGNGPFTGNVGTVGASTNGGTEIIENAASVMGTLTIHQSTPSTFEASWDALFRDGVPNSQFFAVGTNSHLSGSALNLVKDGVGWAVLTHDNDYTGTTVVNAGILQVGRGGIGDTGGINALGTTVKAGATLAGTGWIQGGAALNALNVQSGAFVAPGDMSGRDVGTLNVSGNAIFQAGAEALLQVRLPTYNAPGSVDVSDSNYISWRNGLASDEFSHALSDLVTSEQHDMINVTSLTGPGTLTFVSGSKITLINEGYTPRAGDVFHLLKAGANGTNGVLGQVNVGDTIRTGTEAGTDLTLFELGGNFRWDTSLLNTLGVLLVVTQEGASSLPTPPTIPQAPTRSPATGTLEPGVTFTITCRADANTVPPSVIDFALVRDGAPLSSDLYTVTYNPTDRIPAGAGVTATFTLVASSATKGSFQVRAQNAGGSVTSSAVTVNVNDTPIILASGQPTSRTVDPSLPGAPSSTTFTSTVTGPGPYTAVWLRVDGGTEVPLQTGPATAVVDQSNRFTSSFTLEEITEAEDGQYACRFISTVNESLSVTSNPAILSVRKAVANVVATRTRYPGNTYQGETITFSVTANGDAPLTYRWFRNGTEIPDSNSATLKVTNSAILPVPDVYFCRVTNNVNSADSNSVSLPVLSPVPVIDSSTVSARTVLAGASLAMNVVASGRPTLKYAWKKDGKPVTGATSATYTMDPVSMTHGGVYTCEVSNSTSTKKTAGPADVIVVDNTTRLLPVFKNATSFTLTANVGKNAKSSATYKWFRRTFETQTIPGEDGAPDQDVIVAVDTPIPTNDSRFVGAEYTGAALATLRVGNAVMADDGLYVCKVKGSDNTEVAGCFYDVRVYDTAPENTTPAAFKPGVIGGYYSDAVTLAGDRNKTAVTFSTSSKMPAGLTFNKATGVISGRPTKAGIYSIITWATNQAGDSNKVTSTLQIFDVPAGVAGNFAGPVARSSALNGNLGGRFEMTVTSLGLFSGKLTLGSGTSRSFKGELAMNVDASGTLLEAPSGSFVVPATKTEPAVTVEFDLGITPSADVLPPAVKAPPSVLITNATITSGASSVAFTGWRNGWAAKAVANISAVPTEYLGLYNIAFGLPDASSLVANTDVPQGAGYASGKVESSGNCKLAGRTADGETLTASSFVGPSGQMFLFQVLYKTTTKGSILSDDPATPVIETLLIDTRSTPNDTDNDVTGVVSHVRPPDPAAATKARVYRAGFGSTQVISGVPATSVTTPVVLTVVGGRYIAPAKTDTKVLLGVDPGSNNAELTFLEDGEDDIVTGTNPNVVISIGAASKVTVPKKTTTVNTAGTTLTATAASGAFSGKFELVDNNPVAGQKPNPVKRPVTYQGLIIRERLVGGGTSLVGMGYFLNDQLPQPASGGTPATTTKDTPRLSGMVILAPVGP
ncbi:MAG: hypothetical protein CJBNEKGG_01609 [Prosthecobacter sp.]|nr:hypothetical protein [Prosthecobacter sp.]